MHSFFRPRTKRIYVFVSDDESTRMTDKEFQIRITPYLQGSSIVVYAFVGIPNISHCAIVNSGTAYLKLATSTGGKTYDLCQPDWSRHFAELTADVRTKVKNEFILDLTPKRILSVKINDLVLSSNEYSLVGNALRVHRQNETLGTLTVVYE